MTKTKSIAKQEFIERAIPGLDAMIPQAQKRAGTINGPQLARALLVCIKKGKNMDKIPPTDILLAGSACASMGLIPGDTGQEGCPLGVSYPCFCLFLCRQGERGQAVGR